MDNSQLLTVIKESLLNATRVFIFYICNEVVSNLASFNFTILTEYIKMQVLINDSFNHVSLKHFTGYIMLLFHNLFSKFFYTFFSCKNVGP